MPSPAFSWTNYLLVVVVSLWSW